MNDFVVRLLVTGIIPGLLSAAATDFQAFKAWQTYDDFFRYDWRTASFRWVKGALVGLLTSLGLLPLGPS